MIKSILGIQRGFQAIALIAVSLCFLSNARAAEPTAMQDAQVSLSITPKYTYRPPSIIGAAPDADEPSPASGVDEWASRQISSPLEKPDNWACRTSNNLSRSSIGRNPDGKTISDIQGMLPKC